MFDDGRTTGRVGHVGSLAGLGWSLTFQTIYPLGLVPEEISILQ